MIQIPDKYKNGEYVFPRTDINPKTKNEAYCKNWATAIFSLFARNRTAWGIDAYTKFDELRKYSNGLQDTDKYKSWLLNDETSSTSATVAVDSFDSLPLTRVSKREGWWNVLWSKHQSCSENYECLAWAIRQT